MPTLATGDTPRILISRMSAVGDSILTLPVACALRKKYPNAYLGWVIEERSSPVVLGHQDLDAVVVLRRGWFASPKGILAARRKLLPHRFEFSVDCQSVTKSSLACWLSGAGTRIGCRGKYGCELSPLINNRLIEPQTTHLTDRSLELLEPFEIQRPAISWKYPIEQDAMDQADTILTALRLDRGFAVINAGANWDSRLWEMGRFGEVARLLGEQSGLPSLIVWGNQREQNWASEIVSTSAGQSFLCPATSLAELAAVIKRAKIFVSADTGPLHLAVAVGTPSVALHGVTRPQDSGPYGAPHRPIIVRYDAGSRKQRRKSDNSAMLLITPEMVLNECHLLLGQMGKDAA